MLSPKRALTIQLPRVWISTCEDLGPIDPVLARLDPKVAFPLFSQTMNLQLVDFVRNGLLDSQAKPEHLRRLIPAPVPSRRQLQIFQ